MKLVTMPNLDDADAAYARLIEAHQGLDEAQSAALNARLILVLMNHVGDEKVLAEAIELAQSASAAPASRG